MQDVDEPAPRAPLVPRGGLLCGPSPRKPGDRQEGWCAVPRRRAEQAADPDGDEIEDTKSEEGNEKKILEDELEKERLKEKEELREKEEKEKKRLEEKKEEKAEDKELDLVVAPPKRPDGPGEV